MQRYTKVFHSGIVFVLLGIVQTVYAYFSAHYYQYFSPLQVTGPVFITAGILIMVTACCLQFAVRRDQPTDGEATAAAIVNNGYHHDGQPFHSPYPASLYPVAPKPLTQPPPYYNTSQPPAYPTQQYQTVETQGHHSQQQQQQIPQEAPPSYDEVVQSTPVNQ